MVQLDRVVSADEESLLAEVRIRSDSLFCSDRGVDAWVGIEFMAQAIAAWAGYTAWLRGEPVKLGFLLGTRRYECSRPIFAVGSLLQVHIRRVFQDETGLGSFECSIDDEQGRAATANVTVFQPSNANDFLRGSSE
jgi:predicted hotdog family 3-hydroxylacyl-ACP dehydratase